MSFSTSLIKKEKERGGVERKEGKSLMKVSSIIVEKKQVKMKEPPGVGLCLSKEIIGLYELLAGIAIRRS